MKAIVWAGIILLLTACAGRQKENATEAQVEKLLSQMTLEEKIGQMNQAGFWGMYDDLKDNIRAGRVGSILNTVNPEEINELQRIAVEESRLGIPLIVGRDVIHGFKTIFPIPLGQAASFDPELVKKGARIAATEAREKGIRWTFAPMLDIARDARWGRIAESLGEDPFLAGELGAAMVKGFQGDSLNDPNAIAACVKHFAGYGAAEGGRDYNSTYIPRHQLHNVYLPPFRKAIEAGAVSLMTSFNDNDGIPASANEYLLRDVLRGDWDFRGFVVSDWESTKEMIAHGYAKDDKDAAMLSANAGMDMEMVSGTYFHHLAALVEEGKVSIQTIDEAVRNILRAKIDLGLFETPYADTSRPSSFYAPEHLAAAKEAAVKSAVLLKNTGVLPLDRSKKIAVIGPMADAPHDQLGTWIFDGEKEHTVTPVKALQTSYREIKYSYEPALSFSRDKNTSRFAAARNAAAAADVAVVFVGEESILSGEAHSLSNLNLIGVQSELIREVSRAGKPVVMVVMAGRPLTIERDLPYADAVLYSFHPGTMGGEAILDLLFGKANPSGKLPVTFVREVGQIPLYYNHKNTGRPAPDELITLDKIPLEANQTSLGNTSFYLDSGKDPLFPFGYGLSYSRFEYSDLKLSSGELSRNGQLKASVTIRNNSLFDGTEVAQLYIRDISASITRPVKELKGFRRVDLKAGESKTVEFVLSAEDLAFYGKEQSWQVESGDFRLWIGTNSAEGLEADFCLR